MSSCPPDDTLDAFARGALSPTERLELATHIRDCQSCQARFLPVALRTSALGQTNYDSPKARTRRASGDIPVAGTRTDPELVAAPAEDSGLDDTHVSHDRLTAAKAPALLKGQQLDRYVILERLGAGGMGEVYSAWDPVLDRKVAVKILRADFAETDLREELKMRLLREAQALARLSHPNVVTIHDVGLAGDQVFIAMEFVEGQTLTAWLKGKPRPWRTVLEVFLQAGEGLAAAHAVGITHRDFKPDNVVVTDDGRAHVMDFGLAHGRAEKEKKEARPDGDSAIKRAITQPGQMLGTPAYMSPEALYGKQTDFRSDEFSFCVSLYEALFGVRPFAGESPAAIAAEIEVNRVQPPAPGAKAPRRILQLVLKGLRRNPDERFQTMRALLVHLGRRKSSGRNRLITATVLVLAVVGFGAAAWSLRREQQRCATVADRLVGVWDARTKQAARAAFLGTDKPWAAAAWRDVEQRLDAYSQRWVTLRRQACEASTSAADEELGQNIVCLSRRLADLEAVSQLFSRADAEVVERAVATASGLLPLETCLVAQATSRRTPERDELRHGLAAVKARLDAGKYGEALTQANDLATRATALADQDVVAEARLFAGMAQARTGDPRGADGVIEQAILLASTAGDDELLARAWVERVGAAALAGAGDDADRWIRFARAALARVKAQPELEASLANNAGAVAYVRRRFDDAVAAYQQALALRTKVYGEQHLVVARSHSNLGAAYRAQEKWDQALAEYRSAMAIEEAVLDGSHPAVAETLNNLGNVHEARSDFAAARSALERALLIKERAYGANSLPVAITLTNLGALLLGQKENERADTVLTRSLELKEKLTTSDSLTVALTLTNLAQLRRNQARWSDALEADTRALTIRRARLGKAHPDLAWNLTGLGQTALAQKKLPEAKRSLEEALALRPTAGDARAETLVWLGKTLLLEKDTAAHARGEKLLAEAREMMSEHNPLRAELGPPR